MAKKYTSNILCEKWWPRFKHFHPPMWKIFRWAYRIEKTLLKDCYPVAIGTSADEGEFTIEFSCDKFESDKVTATANNLMGAMDHLYTKDDTNDKDINSVRRAYESWLAGVSEYEGR